jgi:DNA-binding transcriptional regulator/RsmH inhibitor MraZ
MEESRMGMRIYVDFNTTTIDAKERVSIPTQMQPALAQALRPGMVVTLYYEELEVRATVEFDVHDQVWLGQPHWSTRRDLPSLRG